jgi:hypothetical protein
LGDARPHRYTITGDWLSKFSFTPAPHQLYSPELTTSDFFLCGLLKHRREGKKFAIAMELVDAIVEFSGSIRRSYLTTAFRNGEEQ